MQTQPLGSSLLVVSFVAVSLIVGAGLVWLTWLATQRARFDAATARRWVIRTALAVAAWMAAWWFVAASGVIADVSRRPPPLAVVLLVVAATAIILAASRFGELLARALPLWLLIAVQAFRLPLELVMHQAAVEGVMPEQMSYSGLNYDIVTGATALPVAWLVAGGGAWAGAMARLWNLMGALLLANILLIAVASAPMFAAFGPDRLNTWVAYPPYIWLPTVMVAGAIAGHLLVWRHLRGQGATVRRSSR